MRKKYKIIKSDNKEIINNIIYYDKQSDSWVMINGEKEKFEIKYFCICYTEKAYEVSKFLGNILLIEEIKK